MDAAVALLMLKRCVHFDAQFDFAGIERRYRPLVLDLQRWWEQLPRERAASVNLDYDPCHFFAYTSRRPPPPPSPSSSASTITVSRLLADSPTAALIASRWPYSTAATASHVEALLHHFGGVGAWRDGTLVGWAVRQSYGAWGMVHVIKEERGKGIGKALIRGVVRQALEQAQPGEAVGGQKDAQSGDDAVVDEYTPFCYINDDNTASLRLFASCGFVPLFDIDWIEWTPSLTPT